MNDFQKQITLQSHLRLSSLILMFVLQFERLKPDIVYRAVFHDHKAHA